MSERAVPLLSASHLDEREREAPSPARIIEVHAPGSNFAYSGLIPKGTASVGLSLAHSSGSEEVDALSRRVHVVSLVVNVLLFGVKLLIYLRSRALVVLAALIDSTVDLLAQVILLSVNRMTTLSKEPAQVVLYPAGRSRAEPVGVIACALVMAMASASVIRDACVVLLDWWNGGQVHLIDVGGVVYSHLAS